MYYVHVVRVNVECKYNFGGFNLFLHKLFMSVILIVNLFFKAFGTIFVKYTGIAYFLNLVQISLYVYFRNVQIINLLICVVKSLSIQRTFCKSYCHKHNPETYVYSEFLPFLSLNCKNPAQKFLKNGTSH